MPTNFNSSNNSKKVLFYYWLIFFTADRTCCWKLQIVWTPPPSPRPVHIVILHLHPSAPTPTLRHSILTTGIIIVTGFHHDCYHSTELFYCTCKHHEHYKTNDRGALHALSDYTHSQLVTSVTAFLLSCPQSQ